MRLKVFLAGALFLVCSVPVMAQDSAAMMEAMARAATPGDPHKRLDQFAGTWTTKINMWMAPGTQPMTSEGTAENRMALGGRHLEQRFRGNFMGAPFEGVGFTGYDNVKKQYWGTWMDNMSTGMMMTTGWMPDNKTWIFSGTAPDPMTGKDARVEERITIIDNDHHLMEMYGAAPDGTMFKMMEIHFTRKK
jgi:hypothetical protein